MISFVGRGLVLAALLFAASGSVLGFAAGFRRDGELVAWARRAAYGFGATTIAANLLMMYALLVRDFSVSYVNEVGSHDVPDHIAVISLWASLNGSILFWAGVLGLYVVAVVKGLGDRHPQYLPYTLGPLMAVSVFFTLLVSSIANPFAPTPLPIPDFHPGPNALLQNHPLMAFHPPMLYLGYVGQAVPFAMCCAALLAGRLEAGWVAPLRKAMLVPWTFLTIGIVMGGWWSYEVLGWGGYWAWDPVENASFMPWLTATAFLHSAMVLERRGQLKNWTLVLGMASFLLTLLGTFMTRSGVFNSVHSFTQSDIGWVFLAMIAVTFTACVLLLAFRSQKLVDEPVDASQVASREAVILLQNLGFSVFTFTVLVGVMYPLVMEGWFDKRVSVGQPYFDDVAVPLGTALVFLMGVGPALPWGGISGEGAVKRLAAPLGAGVAAVALAAVAGILHVFVLLALFVCAFALASNLNEFVEPVLARRRGKGEGTLSAARAVFTRGRRRYGGHVAHMGVIVACVAIAMSSAYKTETDKVLAVGQAASIGPWTATWLGSHEVTEPHRTATVARFQLARDGEDLGVVEPRLNYYPRMAEPIGTPAVKSGPAGDVYLSLLQVDPAQKLVSVRIMTMPLVGWLWIAPAIVALGSLLALWPERKRAAAAAPAAVAEPA